MILNGMHSKTFCFFLVTLYAGPQTNLAFAQQNDVIGRVLLTRSSVEAIDDQGNSRTLLRRSELFAGDHINTESDGFAQLRMIDGAQIALKESSSFSFHEYRMSNGPNAPGKAFMSLQKGGFRTITGTIGDNNNDTYEMRLPDASVGIRGTTYECNVDQGISYCGVYDGGITVSNEQGSIDLGLGGNYDYVEIKPGLAPVGLLNQPPTLGQQSGVQPSGQVNQSVGNFQQQSANSTVSPPGTNSIGISTISNGHSFPPPSPIQVKPYKKQAVQ